MSWELPLLITLIVSVLGFLWLRPGILQPGFIVALFSLFALVVAPAVVADPRSWLHFARHPSLEAFYDLHLDALFTQNSKMALTLGAVVWLLNRSWQTLWKPVPDLINILGVDVPEPPDVSLAGIRADAATLSWTRPAPNRPVQRYLIQVNGIHVGDSPGNEIAITVTGLKPNHFYNIRVVAMGPNNFQAASETVRLRTFGKDGKPFLGNARVPTSFVDDDQSRPKSGDDTDGPDAPHTSFAAAVEAAPVLDGSSAAVRDTGVSNSGQRRNTVNRRHSPSVTSGDRPAIKAPESDGPEPSLDELNRKFQDIRREINDTLAQLTADETEFLQTEDELKKEKESKRVALKEKDELTAQLKGQVRITQDQMRAADKERNKKDQQLKDKVTKKSKIRDHIAKLEKDVERMKNECDNFVSQRAALEEKRDCDVLQLDKAISELTNEHNAIETDLSNKGKQLNELKEERKHLAGAEDEQLQQSDERSRREWDSLRNTLNAELVEETKKGHQFDQFYHSLAEQISLQHGSDHAYFNPPEAPGVDVDPMMSNQLKRLSHHSSHGDTRLSPLGQLSGVDAPPQLPPGLSQRAFAAGLFIPDSASEPQTEEELRAAGGPLSPSAQAYLPTGLIDADEDDRNDAKPQPLPDSITADEGEPRSPASSRRSYSAISSPHDSLQNLPFPPHTDNSDRSSLNLNQPPALVPAGLRLSSFLNNFQRAKTTKGTDEAIGPPIGSLRAGQSQSFPRETDDHDAHGARRRMSFSFKNHRNSATGLEGGPTHGQAGRVLRSGLNRFTNSATMIFGDRDAESSRPASIASSDMPRPSTDSGSIWNDGAPLAKHLLWNSPGERWPSRSGSRRPSIHGPPANLTTTLASADDEILYETELKDPQTSASQIGVIGSRPPGLTQSLSQRLNPNAPTFRGLFKKDKEKEKERGKDKSVESKGKGKEIATPMADVSPALDDSPSDARLSRDTFSVHTQTSISESHDSLPLDASSSNPQLETTALAATQSRDAENVNSIRKILRKGSSSKFSLSSRLGKDSSLFKKGPGSATNSDRNASADHRSSIGDLDEFGEDPSQVARSYDSVASSPSLGASKTKDSKESRMNWRSLINKKGKDTPTKEKESLEMDRVMGEE